MKPNFSPKLLQPQVIWLLLLLLSLSFSEATASHIRGGNITAIQDTTANPNPYRYFFKMTLYTNRESAGEESQAVFHAGDGTVINAPRARVRQLSADTDEEVYLWEYTYPGPGTYSVYWIGSNRNSGIVNLAAPSHTSNFFISTTFSINPFRGANSTPVIKNPPIAKANVGRKYVYNPAAFDPDGDSLSFKLVAPRTQAPNGSSVIIVPGYTLPSEVGNCQNATGTAPASFTMHPVTGQLEWSAPCISGEYAIAYVIEEWRTTAAGTVKVGEVVSDVQLLVLNVQNSPPVLSPKDTCIVAGTTLVGNIRATDPDGDQVNLSATGAILPGASFTQTSSTNGLATGTFTWSPTCADVRAQPYQVVFRAEDARTNAAERLTGVQPWNIRVIAPAPQNLSASREGSSTKLTWSNYDCQNASSIAIYRRDGIANVTTDECTPGLPASSGYVKIGEVTKGVNSFLDTNGGQGISPLRMDCYKVVAVFPLTSGGQSTASEAVCISPSRTAFDRDAVKDFVKIFPNPVKDRLNLNMLNNAVWRNLRIYSVTGQLLLEVEGNGQSNISVDLPRQAKGFHLLHIQTNNEVVIERILLE